jgi:Fungal specific transcription factor domain
VDSGSLHQTPVPNAVRREPRHVSREPIHDLRTNSCSQCDGHVPCGRCSTTSVECIYEVPVRQSKEHMRTEIEQLRAQQRNNDRLLAALVSDRSDQILDQLRSGEPLESITEKLDESDSAVSNGNVTKFTRSADGHVIRSDLQGARSIVSSPASIMGLSDTHRSSISTQHEGNAWPTWGSDMHEFQEPSTANQQDEMMSWVPDTIPISNPGMPNIGLSNQQFGRLIPSNTINYSRGGGQGKILGEPFGMEEHPERHHPNCNQSWTSVTSDGAFVEHLMALYFCWEYPTFASLSKEHFLEDFRTGNRRHCSSLLVNSVLAVGCRFSNQASARADPNNPDTAGDHFFAEAERQLHVERDRHTLTTIQAMGLMSIRQASCGRSSHSLFLSGQSIRLAVEMGLHLDEEVLNKNSELEREVRSATFWGAFSLDQ